MAAKIAVARAGAREGADDVQAPATWSLRMSMPVLTAENDAKTKLAIAMPLNHTTFSL